jgi:uncharacterized protein YjlB
VETYRFEDDGAFPNSRLPVLLYHDVDDAGEAGACEALFARNGWRGAWRDGIFAFHHFHSTTHEVLGVVAGSASVALGGPHGSCFELGRGDVVALPAGTGHRNAGSSGDLFTDRAGRSPSSGAASASRHPPSRVRRGPP